MTNLTWEPLIDPALWTALAAAALAVLGIYAWRRPVGFTRTRWGLVIGLMTASVALVLVVLLNPTWVERLPPPVGKPQLTVLVDVSASMSTPDADNQQTRFAAARSYVEKLASDLGPVFDVHLATFAGSTKTTSADELASLTPAGDVTDLAAAVTEALERRHAAGQALLVASDGIHNAGGTVQVTAAATLARALDTPIYTRTLGSDVDSRDVAVEFQSPQQMAFVRQSTPLVVQVRRVGIKVPAASLALVRDGEEIERRSTSFSTDGRAEAQFFVKQDAAGLYRFEVEIDPVPGEMTRLNNRATLLLRVIDKPIRVCLVEGKPYWDAKFLTRVLAFDPAVEVDSFIQVTERRVVQRTFRRAGQEPPATADSSPAADDATISVSQTWELVEGADSVLSAERLAEYQVVVLGRDAEAFLVGETVARLRSWVARDGGSLVCYRGQPTVQSVQELAALLPVRWKPSRETRFRVDWTDRGRNLQWLATADDAQAGRLLAQLPTLSSAARAELASPLAVVLVAAQGEGQGASPVLSYQPYGGGRVVVVEGAGMWRWAFLPPGYQQHDVIYRTLWQNLMRWLISMAAVLPGQDLALRPDKVSFTTNERPAATLLMRTPPADGQAPRVVVRGPAIDASVEVAATPMPEGEGAYRVVFGELPSGQYEAHVAGFEAQPGAGAVFDVRGFIDEQLDLQARPDLMARLARDTGGEVLTGAGGAELTDRFQSHRASTHPPEFRRYPAWDRWWVLVGALTVWAASWGLRRAGGLV